MDVEQVKKFIENSFGFESLILLKNYQKWGLLSRTFMMKEHANILQALINSEGHYATYAPEQKAFLESRLYIETLERSCLLIEDFCAIAYGVWNDVKLLPQALLKQPNVERILNELGDDKWFTILRYSPLDELPLNSEEKDFLSLIRAKNLEVLNKFVEVLRYFLELYWLIYTKHKHANTLIYGFQHEEIAGERSLIVPAIYNSKKPSEVKGIIVTPTIHEGWKTLFQSLYQLTLDIVQRTIEYAETGGHLVAERITYFTLVPEQSKRLEQIIAKCDKGITQVSVNAEIRAVVPTEVIQRHFEFLKKLDIGDFKNI